MRAWIDVDNPPQARYLLPLARALDDRGLDVLITARDYGDTLPILESEGVGFSSVGASFGKGTARKVCGLAGRTMRLVAFHRSQPRKPDFVVTGSRSAALAARMLRIPSFVIIDYEYVNLLVYRIAGSYILHPDVIASGTFTELGVPARKLIGFSGLKEDLSFAGIDVARVRPLRLDGDGAKPVRILFRPPAEESHYYSSESRRLALDLLGYLAEADAQIVFSPRYPWQVRDLDSIGIWRHEPVVLRHPIPFVSLLKAVDAVVSAGGTMLREAAFLGVPAYSIFRGRSGAVDRHLAALGRLVILSAATDFDRVRLEPSASPTPMREGARVAEEVIDVVLDRTRPKEGSRA